MLLDASGPFLPYYAIFSMNVRSVKESNHSSLLTSLWNMEHVGEIVP